MMDVCFCVEELMKSGFCAIGEGVSSYVFYSCLAGVIRLDHAAAIQSGSCALRDPPARITSPTMGSFIALNPEIPPNCQRVSACRGRG